MARDPSIDNAEVAPSDLPGGAPHPIAQTNLQLYAQLRTAGWPSADIEGVGRAYRLAAELLAGWYRPSGKPFIDHFVGTAAVAAAAGGRPALVRAALLHNAYGSVLGGEGTADDQRRVREAIGGEAEVLVRAYGRFGWDEATSVALAARADQLTDDERDLVVLRLANEVDDRLDLARFHSEQPALDLEPMVQLADRAEQPVLATMLRRVAREEADGDVEPGLRNAQRVPYRLEPPPEPVTRRAVRAAESVARRALGRARRLRRGER